MKKTEKEITISELAEPVSALAIPSTADRWLGSGERMTDEQWRSVQRKGHGKRVTVKSLRARLRNV